MPLDLGDQGLSLTVGCPSGVTRGQRPEMNLIFTTMELKTGRHYQCLDHKMPHGNQWGGEGSSRYIIASHKKPTGDVIKAVEMGGFSLDHTLSSGE